MSTDASTSAYRIQHLLGEENYQTWAVKITDILTDLQLDDYPKGRLLKPGSRVPPPITITNPDGTTTTITSSITVSTATASEWERKDRQALSAIRLRVTDGPLVYITNASSAKEAWDVLEKMYRPRGAYAIVLLRRKLLHLVCAEGGDIEEHIRKLTSLRTQLTTLGARFDEDEFCTTLLTSLPDSWDTFIQSVDTSSFTDSAPLIARILERDRQRKAKPTSDDVALPARSAKTGKFSTNVSCYGCGRRGHVIADCRDTKAGKTFTEEQKRRNGQGGGGGRGWNSGRAHVTEEAQFDAPAFAFAAASLPPTTGSDVWLADSAATRHIVINKTLFSSYLETPGTNVTGFGQSSSPGSGTVEISSHVGTKAYDISLRDSMHVPNAPYNLISLGRLTSAGCSVQMKGDTMKIHSPGPKSYEIMRGTLIGGLYKVRITRSARSPPSRPTPTVALPSKPSSAPTHTWDKWHRILGHIQHASVKTLRDKQMVTGLNVDESVPASTFCETCVKAKSHVTPFPPASDNQP
ncbi:unnamed protein product [Mycena citricolor]|uniref:CCHC-type domain-containing protein n=1 Tax=Mycena citricolor TaxID=2018698 RepID=A0AAD2HBA2_9AGAR|nr:unnamed protein product [Mycena citricolor]